jgi:cation diffusion facilitator CzcD-associated flavoprotein CzcO
MTEDFDVIIVGAGISGIGAAVHLQKHCPDRRFLILEARPRIGGTWDLFRYPGIRSDSDMYTLGFNFKPWTHARAIADGPAILDYLDETAREHAVYPHIRFDHTVRSARWDSAEARWTIGVDTADGPRALRCGFLYMCSGYYRYDHGYQPDFPGQADFRGTLVHPQHWPQDLDYRGKRVVVIGSGATAVTLVPSMAREAASVTMLQRSPTWVVSRPGEDRLAQRLRRSLGEKPAYALIRWRNVLLQQFVFWFARRNPERMGKRLLGMVRERLAPGFDVGTHFTPRYRPWEQRLCLVPDDDLFEAINSGRAAVVTDTIERFTPNGIRLASGRELPADIIVSATGLELLFAAGLDIDVDGRRVDFARTIGYKGTMFSGVPNFACAFGYTNASWTLKADLGSEYVCRLLNHMRRRHTPIAVPIPSDPGMGTERWIDFSSGYFQRALHRFPRQGTRPPWKLYQNYARDIALFRFARLEDGEMRFLPAGGTVPGRVSEQAA